MGKANNQTKQNANLKSQDVNATGAVEQYLKRDEVNIEVLKVLISREEQQQDRVFTSAKQDLELERIMSENEREDAQRQLDAASHKDNIKQEASYRHNMLEFKRTAGALVTKNVVERTPSGPVADGAEIKRYLYPTYNEVKGYINDKAVEFGFNFEVSAKKLEAGTHEVTVCISHEDGAVRILTTEIDIRYNRNETVLMTHQRMVSTAAKSLLMNAFGIHYVAGEGVPDDVVCAESDDDESVKSMTYKADDEKKPDVKADENFDSLSDEQMNNVTRAISAANVSYDTVFNQMSLACGDKVKSLNDINASQYDTLMGIITHSQNRKNKHKAN